MILNRVLQLREKAQGPKAQGPQHPAVAIALENMGSLLVAQSRYAEAERLYVRALSIKRRDIDKPDPMDPDYREFAICLEKIAVLYRKMGRDGEAEAFEKRIATIRSTIDTEPLLRFPKNWGQRL